MTCHTGIVVKKYVSSRMKVVLLDRDLGMMSAVSDTDAICLGGIIEYRINKVRNTSFIQAIDHIKVPFSLAKQDILFIHHLLELCFYFVPEGSIAPDLFALMEHVYMLENALMHQLVKKCLLVRFFALLGMWPENRKLHTAQMYALLSGSIDFTIDQNLDLGFERAVNEWLLGCVLVHPKIAQFNTIHFLGEGKVA